MTGDRLAEVNENFFVNLRGAKGAKIADGQGVVTIVDDEPRISINDKCASALQGNSGTTPVTFTVSLSAAYDQAGDGQLRHAGRHGHRRRGDYLATSGTLTFAPGETTKTITVDVVGDSTDDGNYKTFYVNLSGASLNRCSSTPIRRHGNDHGQFPNPQQALGAIGSKGTSGTMVTATPATARLTW